MGIAKSLAWAAGGLGFTPLLDYAWHAWVAHGRRPHATRAAHLEHHRTAHELGEPWAEMRENAPQIAGAATVVALALSPLIGVRAAVPAAAGLVLGYAAITLSHARFHQRAPRGPAEEWMWRFHFHHHYVQPKVNFGLTSPIVDLLLGTAEVPDEVLLPEAALPAWWTGEAYGFRVRPRTTRAE